MVEACGDVRFDSAKQHERPTERRRDTGGRCDDGCAEHAAVDGARSPASWRGLGVTTGMFVAGVIDAVSPIDAVGSEFIDRVPPWRTGDPVVRDERQVASRCGRASSSRWRSPCRSSGTSSDRRSDRNRCLRCGRGACCRPCRANPGSAACSSAHRNRCGHPSARLAVATDSADCRRTTRPFADTRSISSAVSRSPPVLPWRGGGRQAGSPRSWNAAES